MHPHILFNLATLAVTAYAASSSLSDNPEAQYLTQTNTDGQVTGQPPLATIPAGVSSLPKRKPSARGADPPVENFLTAGLTSAATTPATALVTSQPAADTSLPPLVTVPAGLSTAVNTDQPSTLVPTGSAQGELKRGQTGVVTLATNADQVAGAFSSYNKQNGISAPQSSSIPAMSTQWYIPPTGSAGSAPPAAMDAAATSGPAAGASAAETTSGASSMASDKASSTANAFKGGAMGLMPSAEFGVLGAFVATLMSEFGVFGAFVAALL